MPKKAQGAFRTISEVADWLDVPAHVLRFWESKFSHIKPVKRAGGRRYYRPDDMLLIGGIKKLLHDDGMTIRGVQKMLKEEGVKQVSLHSPDISMPSDEEATRRRSARRARRKERSETARAAKPPLTPAADTTEAESEAPTEAPEAPFVDVQSEPPSDNVVQWPSHTSADSEPEAADAAPEPAAKTPEAAPAAEIPSSDAPAQEEPAQEEPTPEDPATTPEPEIVATAAENSETPMATPAESADASDIDVPSDPDPATVTACPKAIAAEDALKALRKSASNEPRSRDRLAPLHKRLVDLRTRMSGE